MLLRLRGDFDARLPIAEPGVDARSPGRRTVGLCGIQELPGEVFVLCPERDLEREIRITCSHGFCGDVGSDLRGGGGDTWWTVAKHPFNVWLHRKQTLGGDQGARPISEGIE